MSAPWRDIVSERPVEYLGRLVQTSQSESNPQASVWERHGSPCGSDAWAQNDRELLAGAPCICGDCYAGIFLAAEHSTLVRREEPPARRMGITRQSRILVPQEW